MPEDNTQRVRNACEACHERKIKCKASPGGGPCQTCAPTGRSCFFLPRIKAGRPRRKRSPPPSQPDTSESSHTSPSETSPMEEYLSLEEGAFGPAKDMNSILTPPFSWAQLSGLTPNGFGTQLSAKGMMIPFQDSNPFDQLYDNSQDVKMDFTLNLQDLPVPALSSDGSRASASSSTQSGAFSNFLPSHLSSPELQDSEYYPPVQQTYSENMTSPAEYSKNNVSPAQVSSTALPSFQDLLVKCSEIERLLESLQFAPFLGLNLDTASPMSSLHTMLHAVDSAGDLVLTVAAHLGKERDQASCSTPYFVESTYSDQQFNGHCASINPAVLNKSFNQSIASAASPQDLALRALALALCMRILDVCETLATVQPSNPQSHHHILFLKRLDANHVQVREALQQMECSQTLSREALTQRARHRTLDVQAKLKVAMDLGNW